MSRLRKPKFVEEMKELLNEHIFGENRKILYGDTISINKSGFNEKLQGLKKHRQKSKWNYRQNL